MRHRIGTKTAVEPVAGRGELDQLLEGEIDAQPFHAQNSIKGMLVGKLVGFAHDGTTPLITYPGQAVTVALPARSTQDLHALHIDRDVVLMFEEDDPGRPIIVGCLRPNHPPSSPELAGQVEVDVDGERLIVSAKEQVVLRCGKASITLTKAGKVLIQGAFVSHRSSGVLRLKGGSVQIN